MAKILLILIIYLSISDLMNVQGLKIQVPNKPQRLPVIKNDRSEGSDTLLTYLNILKHMQQQHSGEGIESRLKDEKASIDKRIGEKSAERDELKAPLTAKRLLRIIDSLPDINIPENYTTVLCATTKVSGYGGQKAIGKAYTSDTAACYSVCYRMDECVGINVIYELGVCLFYSNDTYRSKYPAVIKTVFFSKAECTNDTTRVHRLIESGDIVNFNKTHYDTKVKFSCKTSIWSGFFISTIPLGFTVVKAIKNCTSMCHAYHECKAVNYILLTGHCFFLRETIKSAASDLILSAAEGTFMYFHVPKGCKNGKYTCQTMKTDDNETFSCGIPDSSHTPNIGDMASRHRIMGGTEANPHSYPWMVSMHAAGAVCGGVLLPSDVCSDQSDIVLTAAHCTYKGYRALDSWEMEVYLGKHNLSRVEDLQFITQVQHIVRHPHYDHTAYDYALLYLTNPVTYNQHIRPVCLPKPRASPSKPESCIVTGWGLLDQNNSVETLQQMIEPVVSNSLCAMELQKTFNGTYHYDYTSKLCAGNLVPGKSTCKGDSGSPLVCYEYGRYAVFGLVSHGTETDDCGSTNNGTPTVYSSVSAVVGWSWISIMSHLQSSLRFQPIVIHS